MSGEVAPGPEWVPDTSSVTCGDLWSDQRAVVRREDPGYVHLSSGYLPLILDAQYVDQGPD